MRSAIAVLAFVLVYTAPILAQTATGTISGYVEDTSGARVPNAKITLVHSGTKQSRTAYTNERGEFLAALMPIGEYDVSAELAGFRRKALSGNLLRVDQRLTVPITIEPGSVSETVEVVSSAPLLESETSSLGQVIENKKILELPFNGRNPFALGLLAGNTAPSPAWERTLRSSREAADSLRTRCCWMASITTPRDHRRDRPQ